MTTPVKITGFEYGLTPVISGAGLCNNVYGTAGTNYAIESTIHRSGNYSLKIAPNAGTRGCVGWTVASSNLAVWRFYFRIESDPAALVDISHCNGAAGDYLVLCIDPSDHLFKISRATDHTSILGTGPSYTTGQWYCIDIKDDLSANPNVMTVEIDGANEFTGSLGQAATTTTSVRLGNENTVAATYTAYFDDLIISITSADYPIGSGVIEAISPNADGTHNASTVIENQAGTDITAGNANPLVNKIPLNSGTATYIRQSAIGTTNYAAVKFGTVSGSVSSITGIMGVLCYQSATTTANAAETRLYDGSGGTLLSTIYSGDMSESSLFYKSAIGTAPAGGWGTAALGTALVRVGYASDANPNPYWNSLLIEYAYVPTASGPSIGTLTPAEATQSQAVDAAVVNAFYAIIGAEASQAQTSDAGVISIPPIQIIGAENTQAQLSDAVNAFAIYPIAPAENTQAQTSDPAITRGIYPVIVEDYFQAQTSDPALLGFIQSISMAEGTQTQGSDPAVISAVYPLVVAEGSQAQISDAAGVSFGVLISIQPGENTQAQTSDIAPISFQGIGVTNINPAEASQNQITDAAPVSFKITWQITPEEGIQSQASDGANIQTITPIQAGEAVQSQAMDAPSLSANGPVYTLIPGKSIQAQLSDGITPNTITPLIGGKSLQEQTSDAFILILANIILHGNRRIYATGSRKMDPTGARAEYDISNRETIEVDKNKIHPMNIRKAEDVDD